MTKNNQDPFDTSAFDSTGANTQTGVGIEAFDLSGFGVNEAAEKDFWGPEPSTGIAEVKPTTSAEVKPTTSAEVKPNTAADFGTIKDIKPATAKPMGAKFGDTTKLKAASKALDRYIGIAADTAVHTIPGLSDAIEMAEYTLTTDGDGIIAIADNLGKAFGVKPDAMNPYALGVRTVQTAMKTIGYSMKTARSIGEAVGKSREILDTTAKTIDELDTTFENPLNIRGRAAELAIRVPAVLAFGAKEVTAETLKRAGSLGTLAFDWLLVPKILGSAATAGRLVLDKGLPTLLDRAPATSAKLLAQTLEISDPIKAYKAFKAGTAALTYDNTTWHYPMFAYESASKILPVPTDVLGLVRDGIAAKYKGLDKLPRTIKRSALFDADAASKTPDEIKGMVYDVLSNYGAKSQTDILVAGLKNSKLPADKKLALIKTLKTDMAKADELRDAFLRQNAVNEYTAALITNSIRNEGLAKTAEHVENAANVLNSVGLTNESYLKSSAAKVNAIIQRAKTNIQKLAGEYKMLPGDDPLLIRAEYTIKQQWAPMESIASSQATMLVTGLVKPLADVAERKAFNVLFTAHQALRLMNAKGINSFRLNVGKFGKIKETLGKLRAPETSAEFDTILTKEDVTNFIGTELGRMPKAKAARVMQAIVRFNDFIAAVEHNNNRLGIGTIPGEGPEFMVFHRMFNEISLANRQNIALEKASKLTKTKQQLSAAGAETGSTIDLAARKHGVAGIMEGSAEDIAKIEAQVQMTKSSGITDIGSAEAYFKKYGADAPVPSFTDFEVSEIDRIRNAVQFESLGRGGLLKKPLAEWSDFDKMQWRIELYPKIKQLGQQLKMHGENLDIALGRIKVPPTKKPSIIEEASTIKGDAYDFETYGLEDYNVGFEFSHEIPTANNYKYAAKPARDIPTEQPIELVKADELRYRLANEGVFDWPTRIHEYAKQQLINEHKADIYKAIIKDAALEPLDDMPIKLGVNVTKRVEKFDKKGNKYFEDETYKPVIFKRDFGVLSNEDAAIRDIIFNSLSPMELQDIVSNYGKRFIELDAGLNISRRLGIKPPEFPAAALKELTPEQITTLQQVLEYNLASKPVPTELTTAYHNIINSGKITGDAFSLIQETLRNATNYKPLDLRRIAADKLKNVQTAAKGEFAMLGVPKLLPERIANLVENTLLKGPRHHTLASDILDKVNAYTSVWKAMKLGAVYTSYLASNIKGDLAMFAANPSSLFAKTTPGAIITPLLEFGEVSGNTIGNAIGSIARNIGLNVPDNLGTITIDKIRYTAKEYAVTRGIADWFVNQIADAQRDYLYGKSKGIISEIRAPSNPFASLEFTRTLPLASRIRAAFAQGTEFIRTSAATEQNVMKFITMRANATRTIDDIRTIPDYVINALTPEQRLIEKSKGLSIDLSELTEEHRRYVSGLLFPFISWFIRSAEATYKYAIGTTLQNINMLRNTGSMSVANLAYASRHTAHFTGAVVAPYAMLQTWNNTGDRAQFEEQLPDWQRYMPHVIIPYTTTSGKKGHVNMRLELPQVEAFNIVGLDKALAAFAEVRKGTMTPKEWLAEVPNFVGGGATEFVLGFTNPLIEAIGLQFGYDIRQQRALFSDPKMVNTRLGQKQIRDKQLKTLIPLMDTWAKAQDYPNARYDSRILNFLAHGPFGTERLFVKDPERVLTQLARETLSKDQIRKLDLQTQFTQAEAEYRATNDPKHIHTMTELKSKAKKLGMPLQELSADNLNHRYMVLRRAFQIATGTRKEEIRKQLQVLENERSVKGAQNASKTAQQRVIEAFANQPYTPGVDMQ